MLDELHGHKISMKKVISSLYQWSCNMDYVTYFCEFHTLQTNFEMLSDGSDSQRYQAKKEYQKSLKWRLPDIVLDLLH